VANILETQASPGLELATSIAKDRDRRVPNVILHGGWKRIVVLTVTRRVTGPEIVPPSSRKVQRLPMQLEVKLFELGHRQRLRFPP